MALCIYIPLLVDSLNTRRLIAYGSIEDEEMEESNEESINFQCNPSDNVTNTVPLQIYNSAKMLHWGKCSIFKNSQTFGSVNEITSTSV